jgi:zinc protease
MSLLGMLMAVSCAAQQIRLPPPMLSREANGIQMALAQYRRAPTLTVMAIFPGGSASDPAGKAGLAELMATLLRRGTETRNAKQIAEEIEFLGGSLETSVREDRIAVTLNVLAKDADAGLDILADILRRANFPEEEVERERALAISRLQSLTEEPEALADYVAPEVLYGAHPYGRRATIATLETITRDDVRACYRRTIAPGRLMLVAVGDFEPRQMQAKLRARFRDWAATPEPAPEIPRPLLGKPRFVLIDKPDATQAQARFGQIALPRNSPDFFAARVAVTILGGGFTSRLTDEIRVNRSLTYGIRGDFDMMRSGGDFQVGTFTRVETTRALIDATSQVLKRTAERGFTAEELKKAKAYLVGLFAIRMQTPQALAAQLADRALFGLPDNYLQTYLPQLQAVTLAQINRVAKQYFHPKSLSMVLVAPAEKVQSQLKGLPTFEVRPAQSVGKK